MSQHQTWPDWRPNSRHPAARSCSKHYESPAGLGTDTGLLKEHAEPKPILRFLTEQTIRWTGILI
jgi:hypothetical protein